MNILLQSVHTNDLIKYMANYENLTTTIRETRFSLPFSHSLILLTMCDDYVA